MISKYSINKLTGKLHSRYVKESGSGFGNFGKGGVGKIWNVGVGVGHFTPDSASLLQATAREDILPLRKNNITAKYLLSWHNVTFPDKITLCKMSGTFILGRVFSLLLCLEVQWRVVTRSVLKVLCRRCCNLRKVHRGKQNMKRGR